MKYMLKNAFFYNNAKFEKTSLIIDGNSISFNTQNNDCKVYDCDGLYIFPGFVDVHVHLREPGFSYKETVLTGTKAALKGGYTNLCTMPNLNPVPDSLDNLNKQLEIIKKDAKCTVLPFASITKGQMGNELSDMETLSPYVAGFSDDGRGVQDHLVMKEAMIKAKKLNKIISAHCEDNSLINGGVIHDGEFAKENGFNGICSESEYGPIKRDIKLLKETKASYHVCHISCKESVDVIRQAKKDGVDITCETAPHYLVLNDMMLKDEGRFKMNPPIRSEEDRLNLIDGIKDGTIDMIATDHAPHSYDEKSKGLNSSLMGIVGLETAFSVLYTKLVKENIITLEKLIELMSVNPRNRFFKDTIDDVDLCIFDLDKNYKIDSSEFVSKGKATPFDDMNVFGECKMVIKKGEVCYDNLTEAK